jgi:hypothetical protein
MTNLRILTGAQGILSVAHVAADGRLHGHTYTVRAWWTAEPCAIESKAALARWLSKFDHGQLPPNMSRAERIGEQCLMALGCCRVEVMREAEGVFAVVEPSQKEPISLPLVDT